ncbi:hypothetical protein PR202_ga24218 [Eleusine coracana subsp. coracana]|uniref:GDSL esterase/lipase n=1 Tax=Eleusine coracana subsp. coracana TaxID=191504 RepID=A0AAV5D8J0_ELECO|nr:hypothetical protein PR202_ga24218 [Eleusine coracana subsp. coracana]
MMVRAYCNQRHAPPPEGAVADDNVNGLPAPHLRGQDDADQEEVSSLGHFAVPRRRRRRVTGAAASSPHAAHHRRRYKYNSIFSFGDSFADTGNNPAVFAWHSVFDHVMRPPYGTTFFGRPTGRNCDGRLILDFIAERLGIPYLPPYLGPPFASPSPANDSSGFQFHRGASFAVGAATALDAEFYHSRDIPGGGSKFPFNTSLSVQMDWFESLMNKKPSSLCRTARECRKVLGRSLLLVGEFGVNDYHFSFQRKSVPERLIKHGARTLVVPGVIPSGCSPPILAMSFPDAEYDSRTGCLKAHNELGRYHNAHLQRSIDKLRTRHPNARIIYADFFTPVMEMVESPHKFGFREDVLTVCCGGPGKNNFNGSVMCGDPKATTCSDPSASLYWDGVHFTEAANRYIADTWLSSINFSNARDYGGGAKGAEPSSVTATIGLDYGGG